MSAVFNIVWLAAVAYVIGSIPFAVIVGRMFIGRDIREGGSGHAGATNAMRQAGWGAGVLVLALDVAKGLAAVWLGEAMGGGPVAAAAAGAAVVAGHCWPVFAGFRGGMGLATAGGALLPIYPLGFVVGVGMLALGSLTLRHSARGNVATGLLLGPALWALSRSSEVAALGFAVGLVIAARSMSNWERVYTELWLDREQKPAGKRR